MLVFGFWHCRFDIQGAVSLLFEVFLWVKEGSCPVSDFRGSYQKRRLTTQKLATITIMIEGHRLIWVHRENSHFGDECVEFAVFYG